MASLKESGGWQEGGNKMAKVLLGEDSGYRAMEWWEFPPHHRFPPNGTGSPGPHGSPRSPGLLFNERVWLDRGSESEASRFWPSRLMARSRHAQCADEYPLLAGKRTWTNPCLLISIYTNPSEVSWGSFGATGVHHDLRMIFFAIPSATARSLAGMIGLLLQPARDEDGLRAPGSHFVTGWAAISFARRAVSSSSVSPIKIRFLFGGS